MKSAVNTHHAVASVQVLAQEVRELRAAYSQAEGRADRAAEVAARRLRRIQEIEAERDEARRIATELRDAFPTAVKADDVIDAWDAPIAKGLTGRDDS